MVKCSTVRTVVIGGGIAGLAVAGPQPERARATFSTPPKSDPHSQGDPSVGPQAADIYHCGKWKSGQLLKAQYGRGLSRGLGLGFFAGT